MSSAVVPVVEKAAKVAVTFVRKNPNRESPSPRHKNHLHSFSRGYFSFVSLKKSC
jgi:hypothetical protein